MICASMLSRHYQSVSSSRVLNLSFSLSTSLPYISALSLQSLPPERFTDDISDTGFELEATIESDDDCSLLLNTSLFLLVHTYSGKRVKMVGKT